MTLQRIAVGCYVVTSLASLLVGDYSESFAWGFIALLVSGWVRAPRELKP